MAIVHKCDRCGRYYDGFNNTVESSSYDSDDSYDLCDECIVDFYEFIRGVSPKTLSEKLRDELKKAGFA